MNDDDDNDDEDSADDADDSGAIGASAAAGTSRFTRPDYSFQGLLARAKKRVKERGGRVNVAEGDGEQHVSRELDAVSFFPFIILPVNNR